MTSETERMVERHRQSALVVDTNLLLLLIIGGISPTLISRHKRTRSFILEDFELLVQVVRRFPRISTTPSILAELDNLARQGAAHSRIRIQDRLRELIPGFRESHFRSAELVTSPQFLEVSLTDCGILRCGHRGQLVLTADLELYRLLLQQHCDVINFNQLREQEWN